jgi:hypothetical protein
MFWNAFGISRFLSCQPVKNNYNGKKSWDRPLSGTLGGIRRWAARFFGEEIACFIQFPGAFAFSFLRRWQAV